MNINELLTKAKISQKWNSCPNKHLAIITYVRSHIHPTYPYIRMYDSQVIHAIADAMKGILPTDRYYLHDLNLTHNFKRDEAKYTFIFRLYSDVDATLLCLHGIDGFKIHIRPVKDDKPYWQKTSKAHKNTIPFKPTHYW
jgi:hypothetical protein